MDSLSFFRAFGSASSPPFLHRSHRNLSSIKSLPLTCCSCFPAFLAAAVLFSTPSPTEETLANIPQTLSGDDTKQTRIQRPRSKKAESCTAKCVGTCIRGGAGSPGEGILNVRRIPNNLLGSVWRSFHKKRSKADMPRSWDAEPEPRSDIVCNLRFPDFAFPRRSLPNDSRPRFESPPCFRSPPKRSLRVTCD